METENDKTTEQQSERQDVQTVHETLDKHPAIDVPIAADTCKNADTDDIDSADPNASNTDVQNAREQQTPTQPKTIDGRRVVSITDDGGLIELQGEPDYPKWKTAISMLIMVGVAILIAFGVRTFIMSPYEIPSGSMEHTLEINDHVFSEKISYIGGKPSQGDIITFADPETAGTPFKRTLIKRVVATEGQTVDFADGKLVVDGVPQEQDYIVGVSEPLPQQMDGVEIEYPYVIPEGHVWAMGDNRENSLDSRYFGPVDIDTITGHAFFRYFPFDRIGALE